MFLGEGEVCYTTTSMVIQMSRFFLCLALLAPVGKNPIREDFLAPPNEAGLVSTNSAGQEALKRMKGLLPRLNGDWHTRWDSVVVEIEKIIGQFPTEAMAEEIIRETTPWLDYPHWDVRGAAVWILAAVAKAVPTDLVRQEIVGLLEPHLQDESQTVKGAVAWAMAAIERSLVSERTKLSPRPKAPKAPPSFGAVGILKLEGEEAARIDSLLRKMGRLIAEQNEARDHSIEQML